MELILLQDVENLGFKDDIVTVKNGYARNYLIPHGHAVLATDSAKKVLNETLKQRAHKEEKIIADARQKADALAKIDLKMEAKVGKGNKLFGSINNADLADKLAGNGVEIEKKFIQIQGGTIKALGHYTAHIRLHREVVVDFEFDVVPGKE
ncbi:MAG: 50S ribosomal protein L9 [Bacteroidota bacterium]|nr:50S ribosomal protein L9 [Bacteroidota bacterium]MDX5404799.1 50S ribosomal protein L9 [Bacteroidota bacterium]MDX5428020.1 50S ribosomal protein L9 [Bacteroidota bacterium]MDX5447435.1 50S ribosomal protein L9 [Bacteroidota bacterium]MDX5505861.1 50S ribosomal protein L9 [Bacteroidota bacterium]